MPNLPRKKDCCGCSACVDSCPKGAIALKEDSNGFLIPIVNHELCIECKLCERKCHILNQNKLVRAASLDIKTFAGWSTNKDIIKRSASGGVFGQLAWNFLNEPDTYVYGAAFAEDNTIKHIEIDSRNVLAKLQNSKYQQSDATGVYSLVVSRLKSGKKVLFSGVPCQIAALKTFIGTESKYPNLFTVEVICHGVPSNHLYRTAIKVYKAKRLVAYRHKHHGWGPSGNHPVYILSNGEEYSETEYAKDFLFRSYLNMNNIRESCHRCRYANLNRIADLTIGDFWGLEKSHRYDEYKNEMGTSIVLANTDKGLNMITTATQLNLIDCEWTDFLPMNNNLYQPQQPTVWNSGKYIKLIRLLPLNLQKVILQHGSSNPTINLWYWRLWKLFKFKHIKDIETYRGQALSRVLKELNQK